MSLKLPMTERVVCEECRSPAVQCSAWTRYSSSGTLRDAGGDGPTDYAFCPDCGEVDSDTEPLSPAERRVALREWRRRATHAQGAMIVRAMVGLPIETASHVVLNATTAVFYIAESPESSTREERGQSILDRLIARVNADHDHRGRDPGYDHDLPRAADLIEMLTDMADLWDRAIDGDCVDDALEQLREITERGPGQDLKLAFADGWWHVSMRRRLAPTPGSAATRGSMHTIADAAHPNVVVAANLLLRKVRS